VEDASLPWDTILLTAAMGVGAFLLVTQKAFFDGWVAYATRLGTVIPTFIKLFGGSASAKTPRR
jgi:hypothetical protein